MNNPFLLDSEYSLAALPGIRGGYLQLAPTTLSTSYKDLPIEMFVAAKAWATRLESLGAKRVYWITLSEVLPHLHIHLYPRWHEDEARGIALFEERNESTQPPWTPEMTHALTDWATEYSIALAEAPVT